VKQAAGNNLKLNKISFCSNQKYSHKLQQSGQPAFYLANKLREYGHMNFGKQIARSLAVSLCWQNLDPLEDSRATDNPVFNIGETAPGSDGEKAGATRMIARLRTWCRSVVPSDPISAGNGIERIRKATE
jgi:hypothetical protein